MFLQPLSTSRGMRILSVALIVFAHKAFEHDMRTDCF